MLVSLQHVIILQQTADIYGIMKILLKQRHLEDWLNTVTNASTPWFALGGTKLHQRFTRQVRMDTPKLSV